jgi:hypothetical protein
VREKDQGLVFPFLAAEWRLLAMANYEIGPFILLPYLPPGIELDFWNGRTYAGTA